jgi:hypothetical protein
MRKRTKNKSSKKVKKFQTGGDLRMDNSGAPGGFDIAKFLPIGGGSGGTLGGTLQPNQNKSAYDNITDISVSASKASQALDTASEAIGSAPMSYTTNRSFKKGGKVRGYGLARGGKVCKMR